MLKQLATLGIHSFLLITGTLSMTLLTADHALAQVQCNPSGNTQQMLRCAEQDYRTADQRLNQVYQRLIARINATEKQRLVEVQRLWIQFRDKTCQFESALNVGGTLEPLVTRGCLTRMTEERTQYLENYWQETRDQPLN